MDRFPPPVSGAFPVLGHIVEFIRKPVELIGRGSREVGGVFSLRLPGRRAVVLLGAERNRFFFAETDRKLSIRTAYPFFERMFSPEFYFFAGVEEYRRQREIVVPRFQGRQLDGYVTAMLDETAAFEEHLGDAGEFNLTDELGPLVMRIAARCFLGPDFGSRMDRDFFAEFRRFSAGMNPALPQRLPLPSVVRSNHARDRLRAALGGMIRERRANPVSPPDFLQTLAEATYADGTPVPDLVLVNMILLFTWAGHETTTGHISWALVDLLGNPEHVERVRAETGEIDLAGVKRLAHLDNCLHETERLHPVAHVLVRQAAETFELDGHVIPEGTMVIAAPSVSHRLPAEHARPDEFRPDRFTEGREGKLERQALIGFGGGLHRCTGVHFAYLEMKVVIARLLRRYDFSLLDPDPRPVPGMHTKWPDSPCRVRYVKRVPAVV
ncbi:sterol 14-demethylase [Saccharothrix tamanrassetensis]|uniref:Sterol 14-demethylase n=1 Tax=Saccharothrix tamanrassetensis TaxID=1051531 RepID=A0A841CFT4_9PSEU|nr:cytochrome P450 [Saccharothrix tamanrassetensis]MBB5955017.1 sterol 14-demethylase [Saccharothrix tamanrassetensis]